jgi:homocysteine S-methyltransferase
LTAFVQPKILPLNGQSLHQDDSSTHASYFADYSNVASIMPMYPAPILILDGGLGTTLKDQYQAEVDGATRPLWSSHLLISDPAKLLDAQTAFADAGADIVLTATYQASLEGFARTTNPENGSFGVSRAEAETYMRSAVGISRASFENVQTVRGGGNVALSLGAYGAVMVPSQEYTGKYDDGHKSLEQLRDWHKTRLDIFTEMEEVWHDIDMVAFETVPLLAEIDAVRQTISMAQQNSANCKREKPFWISCVFPGKELRLPDGSSVDDVVKTMLAKRENAAMPFAIGINCTKIGKLALLLKEFEGAVNRMTEAGELGHSPALVLYPDGTKGEVYNTTTHEWEMPEQNHDMVSSPILPV